MPFYEYQCTKCGHEEEVLQKISDKPLKKCSECGKSSMQKKVSAAAFRLKGGGWYETDFKSGPKKNLEEKNVAGDKKTDKKADGKPKTETKKAASGDSTKSKKIKN
ncbi:Type I antifreeze protein [hydrothermal vent metagenome]|uniref:Type I antifreeze protein n=1 Tax=hydrothermal vent metagenome TaxID=652676 RepID=A0A3B0WAI2_9ZZZZ